MDALIVNKIRATTIARTSAGFWHSENATYGRRPFTIGGKKIVFLTQQKRWVSCFSVRQLPDELPYVSI
jgi:hypothetical protein